MRKAVSTVLAIFVGLCMVALCSCNSNATPSITARQATVEVAVGETVKVTPKVRGGGSVSFESLNEEIATVDSNGNIYGVSVGTTSVVATESVMGKTATIEVQVIKPITALSLNVTKYSIDKGESYQLIPVVLPEDATQDLFWTTSNEEVATVDEEGNVFGVEYGTAKITVSTKNGELFAECEITVEVVKKLVLNETEATLGITNTLTLTATIDDVGVENLEWTSEDKEVAEVSTMGVVTAKKVGQTTITATTKDGLTATCVVNVIKNVESIELREHTVTVVKDNYVTLVATVLPEDATNKNYTWESEDELIATVDQTGKVTGVAAGTVTIYVTTEDGEKTDECEVTVVIAVENVSFSQGSMSVNVGSTVQLEATVSPFNATNKNLSWDSSVKTVATVDATGLVSGLLAGDTVITVTTEDGEKTAEITVHVLQPVTSVSLDKSELLLTLNGEYTLTATVLPENASNKNVSFASDATTYVTVDDNGLVKGIAVGSANVTVTTEDGGKEFTCTVEVIEVEIPKYMAVGQKLDKINGFTYNVESGDSLSLETATFNAVKAGTSKLKISNDSFNQTFEVKVIDFGNTTGNTFDLATDTTLWNYSNKNNDNVTITLAQNVEGSLAGYKFNALQYYRAENNGTARDRTNNLLYLDNEIIKLAKSIGYKYLTYYVYIPVMNTDNSTTNYIVMNCATNGALPVITTGETNVVANGTENKGTWTKKVINLATVSNDTVGLHDGCGIGWGINAQYMYLAQVEFIGADISDYAKNYITASGTAGKSNDMISQDLIGKLYQLECNTSTLSYGAGGGKETALGGNDYIKLTKAGYQSQIYFTRNAIEINSEWIQAAKSLGYDMVGLYFLKQDYAPLTKAAFIKKGVDGKCYGVSNKNSGQWSSTSEGFVSIDISNFEVGDSLYICSTGETVSISGMTFRKKSAFTPSLAYFNYDVNMI